MKKTLIAALLASTFLTPALADEIDIESTIDAVTVFPRGAEITRIATVDVRKGEHTLLLNGLPGDIDPQSIRVSGDAGNNLKIRSIDSNVSYLTGNQHLENQRRAIEDQIEVLQDELVAFQQEIESLKYQRKLIQQSAIRPIATNTQDDESKNSSVAELGELFDLVAVRLVALDKQTLEIGIKSRKTSEKINELSIKLTELAPKQTATVNVAVDFTSEQSTSARFKVKYRIQNAYWQPFYDARLETGDNNQTPSLELVRRAEIIQTTTEEWNNVELVLSTARSNGATSAPELFPHEFQVVPQQPAFSNQRYKSVDIRTKLSGVSELADQATEAEKQQEIREEEAAAFSAGFQAVYKINGRFTVDNRGTAKKVRISSEVLDADLSIHAAPVLDLNAYLTASFTPGGENPLLPGRAMLFRDNVYMGQGHIPLIASGEEHELGFGIDDQVRITRSEAKRKTGESGILSTERIEENSWITKVKNLRGQSTIVKIYDRMPYGVHEDIEVTLMSNTTRPTEREIENKRGIFGWTYKMEPGQEKTIRFGYRVSHPQS